MAAERSLGGLTLVPKASCGQWGFRAHPFQACCKLPDLVSLKNGPNRNGDPKYKKSLPYSQRPGEGLRPTSLRHGRRQLPGAFQSRGASQPPAHLRVSGQLQAELELLTGAQCATSRGDFCFAEACLVPHELADTRVGLLSGAGLPRWTGGPGRVLSSSAGRADGGGHSRTGCLGAYWWG